MVSKLERVLRHFDQVIHIKVLLSTQNESQKERRQRAECSIQVKGNALHAASKHFDLYAAIDELADKLDRRVLSYKTRKLAVRNVASRHELALSIQS